MWGPNQSRFLSVKGWNGTFQVVLKEQGNGIFGGFPATYTVNQSVTGSIRADRWDASIGGWLGSLDGTGTIDNKATIPFGECTMTITQKGSGSIAMQKYAGKPSVSFITLDLGAPIRTASGSRRLPLRWSRSRRSPARTEAPRSL